MSEDCQNMAETGSIHYRNSISKTVVSDENLKLIANYDTHDGTNPIKMHVV
jgi:hypothetical protein